MDQIVARPEAGEPPAIETALGINGKGRAPKRRRFVLYAVVAVLAAGALYGGYRFMQPTPGPAFATVPVERGDLTVEVSATGTLQPLIQVDISSELSGVVRSVSVAENQRVAKGDILAELDTTRIAAQVERSAASVKAAEAKLADSQTTLQETEQALDRTSQLTGRGMATAQALDAATAARDRAASAVQSAEANLAIASAELKLQQADLAKSTIYAPIEGVVLTRSVDPGQTVASSFQAPVLFVIAANLARMELKAAIDEADIGTVKPGQKASFTVDAFPGRTFQANIRDIAYASVTTDGVVTYDGRLDVDNEELLLRPGMTATVSVITREARDVITVPSAVFRYRPPVVEQNSGWSLQRMFMPRMRGMGQRSRDTAPDGMRTLYVLKDGQPQPVRVRTGSTDGELTEIVSGLEVGDQVIVGDMAAGRGR